MEFRVFYGNTREVDRVKQHNTCICSLNFDTHNPSKVYLDRAPHHQHPVRSRSTALRRVPEDYESGVTAVAGFPDRQHIVTGLNDKTLLL